MQVLIVVAVKDRLADVFSQPMYFATEGQAKRAFTDAINDPQNNMSRHPDDYDMFRLGTFDDSKGKFENEEQPKQIAVGKLCRNDRAVLNQDDPSSPPTRTKKR